jgi:nicotinate-nucleotide adenylyltransferase
MGGAALGGVTAGSAAPVRAGSIGILGGTFDPFHVGHLALARAARDQLGLERVLVIPAGVPPHKPGRPISPPEERMRLVEAGIAGEPRLEASRIELDRPGPSWTVDTVEQLAAEERAEGREPDLTIILSAESFAGLPTWHEPWRLFELARIAVAPRADYPALDVDAVVSAVRGAAGRVEVVTLPPIGVSASEVRRRASAGEPLDGLVPPAVQAVIRADRLYRQPERHEDRQPVTDPMTDAGTPPGTTATTPRPDGLPNRRGAAAGSSTAAAERPPLDIARRIVELAEDKKAADIVLLDLTGLTTLADAFVICSGGSERQLEAIADGVIEGMRAEKVRPIGREGTAASHWVLVDFGAVVVHVFTPPERDYYSLEKHWSEAKTVLRVQ